jgi:hypothetical protein
MAAVKTGSNYPLVKCSVFGTRIRSFGYDLELEVLCGCRLIPLDKRYVL